jgi:4-diphosphocytidyl-2-C-methyl-D-erythritol kinase
MMSRKSPAKINLILKVLRKREDGYHDIVSLMQRISIYDDMRFVLSGDEIMVRCPGGMIPEDESNIVYKAARELFSYRRYPHGVSITIDKKIPVAAGLGGGSSNAATALVTLNEMAGLNCSRKELMEIGTRIGADIPFFISGVTAWVTGIGDRIQPAQPLPDMWFVLVNPDFGISTKEVYEKLGLTKSAIRYTIPPLKTIPRITEELDNDLEKVSLRLHPVLCDIKKLLIEYGALGSLMSGSGPTVFGIFENREDALNAESKLRKDGVGSIFVASSV